MRFAIVDGEKREAEKGLIGLCVGCEQIVGPKCGPIRIKHWAHKSECRCDRWWENETEWHRSWKNSFPAECQEIRHKADNGEWHIADVVTKQGHFLEFQHSFLEARERIARNSFYGSKLVWIIDGLRRSKDRSQFDMILRRSKQIPGATPLIRLPSVLHECSIVKEWSECSVPVFLDFGADWPLWCLLPKSPKSESYIGPFSRQVFVDLHNGKLTKSGQSFAELMRILIDSIVAYENLRQPRVPQIDLLAINRSNGFRMRRGRSYRF